MEKNLLPRMMLRRVPGVIGYILLAVLALTAREVRGAGEVQVAAGDVSDTRSTTSSSTGLELTLNVTGDLLAQAKGVRPIITKAVDDNGTNLLPNKQDHDFKEVKMSGNAVEVKLSLNSPARKAAQVREVDGALEIYVPRHDPQAVVAVNNVQQQTGHPLTSRTLHEMHLTVSVWTRAQYQKYEAQHKSKGSQNGGQELAKGLTDMLASMFGGGHQSGNSIVIVVKDPQDRLVDVGFTDPKGHEVKRNSRMQSGSGDAETITFDFDKKPPANTRLNLYVATPKSIVKTPFKVTAVPLP
ncbi:MAG: hypothetical protein JO316_17250 [Abitibacteriaceae bacterium]|nr:hypothetical protein [Abditibacteriaceae bacterium]MBV9867104.1 hypothetical protein [Abditibacteriaceae bacterium]